MQLVQEVATSLRLSQAMQDLDMLKIFPYVDCRMTEKEAADFLSLYFTSSSEELTERLKILSELKHLTTADSLQKAIDLLSQLQYEEDTLTSAVSRLRQVLYGWRRVAVYRKAVATFHRLLSERDFAMSEDSSSKRLRELREYFQGLYASSLFSLCEDTLNQLTETLPLPRYLEIGLNLREDGYPTEMGVLKATGHQTLFGDAPQEEIELNALITSEDPGKPSYSVGPEFVYNRGLYGSHFDEYLERAMEREWKGQITKAQKLLDRIELPEIPALTALVKPLSFYQVGLLFAETFENKGYPLCRPVLREGASLSIKNALYPDFILRHEGVTGNDLTLQKGNAVIITGPNHSGKTSYLKTIGQCYFLAELGFFVPASSMELEPVENIYTLFSAGEDSSMTASRMGVEVKKLTDILKNATARDLILLNEPMTSTNPVEAVSICGDLTRHFLEKGITHLLVTHLYDVYFLLKASLTPELLPRLESLITQSYYDESALSMVHSYRLIPHEPLGNSYARETAVSYGITLDQMIDSQKTRAQAEEYLAAHNIDSIYT